jgi:hypothetical protein
MWESWWKKDKNVKVYFQNPYLSRKDFLHWNFYLGFSICNMFSTSFSFSKLTPWVNVLLEKPSHSPSQEIPHRSFTVFPRAKHQSLPWARCIQSTSSHPIFWRSILILSYHLCLDLLSGLFLSGFPTKILCSFLNSSLHYKKPLTVIHLGWHS